MFMLQSDDPQAAATKIAAAAAGTATEDAQQPGAYMVHSGPCDPDDLAAGLVAFVEGGKPGEPCRCTPLVMVDDLGVCADAAAAAGLVEVHTDPMTLVVSDPDGGAMFGFLCLSAGGDEG